MRLVIKLGTSILADDKNQLDLVFLRDIVDQIAMVKNLGHEIVIVSSGAVAAGRSEFHVEHAKKNIPLRQVFAAIGQGFLIKAYHDFFAVHDIAVAQALLTNYDFVNRKNFLNTKNIFDLMLVEGIIPIVNENDVTTIDELKFGDNDMLSSKTAAAISADYLIILTDVDGLFTEDPRNNPSATLIPVVEKIDEKIFKFGTGSKGASSLGGMVTKLRAAQYVTSVGIPMFIANGKRKKILECVMKAIEKGKQCGTFFKSQTSKVESQKKWLRPKIQQNAWIEIDSGAVLALAKMGKSLLPSGVCKVYGEFQRGDVIEVRGEQTLESGMICVGYGQVNYDCENLDKIKKHRSDEVEKILGFSYEEEVIHRDRMVILH